jgi:hypothetical protein
MHSTQKQLSDGFDQKDHDRRVCIGFWFVRDMLYSQYENDFLWSVDDPLKENEKELCFSGLS